MLCSAVSAIASLVARFWLDVHRGLNYLSLYRTTTGLEMNPKQ